MFFWYKIFIFLPSAPSIFYFHSITYVYNLDIYCMEIFYLFFTILHSLFTLSLLLILNLFVNTFYSFFFVFFRFELFKFFFLKKNQKQNRYINISFLPLCNPSKLKEGTPKNTRGVIYQYVLYMICYNMHMS